MRLDLEALLKSVRTVADMATAFADEERCRDLLEAMVWPDGPVCPECGGHHCYRLADRTMGGKARPGLHECADRECRFQFTATTRTPLHATKLPIRTWLMAMWLMLQADKGMSSVRLAEALGVSQPTAWRLGHAVRVLTATAKPLAGVVEFDVMMTGGGPRKDPANPKARKGKQGHTTKRPVAVAVERATTRDPSDADQGPKATARPIPDQTAAALKGALDTMVDAGAHLMSDQSSSIAIAARGQIAHDTVNHSAMEFARGGVHTNSAESFNDRFRRTVIGVFHHVSSDHVARYLDEASWRWRQRTHAGKAVRKTRKGRSVERDIWDRVPPAVQIATLLRGALGRELRRRPDGGIDVLLIQPVFG